MDRNLRSPRTARPQGLGEHVRRCRIAASLTQAGLASLAGLSRKTVCRLESDGAGSSDTISAVEAALGFSPSTFVSDWDADWSLNGDSPGARMRRLRKSRGYGLKQFAALVGLETSTLSKLERGVGEDLVDRWLKLVSDHPFGFYLEFRTHEDLEGYLLGHTAFTDVPRGSSRMVEP